MSKSKKSSRLKTSEFIIDSDSVLGQRILDSQLFNAIPYELIDQALASCGDRENRRLRKLSDHMVIVFIILMCLHRDLSYGQVFERLQDVLEWLSIQEIGESITDSSIYKARKRVGFEPVEHLYRLVVKTMCTPTNLDAFLGSHRVMILDGTLMDVPDTPENEIFGRKTTSGVPGPFPQARLVAIMEFHSRAIVDVELAGLLGSDERTLSKQLLERLPAQSLVIADRLLLGTPLCRLILERDSHFLIRAKDSFKLIPIKRFTDGSYLASLRQGDENALVVRVIEYGLKGSKERFRVVTSMLDPKNFPAKKLATLYHCRWTGETIFSELKVGLCSQQIVLRSKSPTLVAQEIYGLLLAHYLVRSFIFEAASHSGLPPKLFSYENTAEIIIREVPKIGTFPPSGVRSSALASDLSADSRQEE